MTKRTPKPIPTTPTPAAPFSIQLAEVKTPKIEAHRVKMSPDDWVRYGDNNLWPDFLIDCVKKSENHSAFINLRGTMIKGDSITYSDDVKPFLESLDEDDTTIEDLWADWATDMSILETFAAFVRYNRTKTAIVAIDYLDSSKVRPSKQYALDADGNPTLKVRGYWVSQDWSNLTQNPPIFYERFNPANINDTTQLHFYHRRALGQPWLPEVSYISCLNYVLQEDEMSKYGLNTMLNGFFTSSIVNIPGATSPEQQQVIKSAMRGSFTGSENASKLMVTFQDSKDPITVTPINTGDNSSQLQVLSDKAQQAIATAHRCQTALAAVMSSSGFNSEAALLKTAQEQFQKNVINDLQRPMTAFVKKVLGFNGYTGFDFAVSPKNLVSDSTPDWLFQDVLTPEKAALHYGYTKEDVRPELLTPQQPQGSNNQPQSGIPDSPYPNAA